MKKLSFREVFQNTWLGHLLAHHPEDTPDLEAFSCPALHMPVCTLFARSVDSDRPLWASNPQPHHLSGPSLCRSGLPQTRALASPDSWRPAYCQLLGPMPCESRDQFPPLPPAQFPPNRETLGTTCWGPGTKLGGALGILFRS